ncbi:MAG: DNA-processing protein DprA [Oscillospiraceae bacterium]|nr:DNA-processing protein DprA [Oscillospiraceae bacterium]
MKYWVWLAAAAGVGNVSALKLLEHFGSPEKVFEASEAKYLNVPGVEPAKILSLSDKSLDYANKVLADCDVVGCKLLSYNCPSYPERLKNIYDPPLLLYIRGNLPLIDSLPVVSVVGTRDCTPYGINAAMSISKKLSERGLIVATGLARGVDSAAARGALQGGSPVIGIVGTGLSTVYPPENKGLFEDVANHGAIISEYPPKVGGARAHFPARNRLLSGISLGVAVIEAPAKSGALITAARALEQGRDVFTLPGNVGAVSCEGSNALLRDGAIAILSADDIICEYEQLFPKIIKTEAAEKKEIDNFPHVEYIDYEQIVTSLEGNEKTVAKAVGDKNVHIDTIITCSGLSSKEVLTAVTMLELKGCLKHSGGKHYCLTNP